MDPNLIDQKFNKAVAYEKDKKYFEALKEYLEIISIDNKHRETFVNLGSLFSRMNNLSKAMNCYKMAVKLKEDFITYFNIGCIYYKTKKYKDAIINFEKSKEFNNKFALSMQVMGLCYSKLGNIKAAETNFFEVLKIIPNNKVSLVALSIIFYNTKRYDLSMKNIECLLKFDPNNVKIKELKSNILLKTGKYDQCADEVKSLAKISDGYKYYDDYINSVPVEVLNDKYGTIDEKIELLEEKALVDNDSLISLSLCHLLIGNTETAIDYLFKAKKRLQEAS